MRCNLISQTECLKNMRHKPVPGLESRILNAPTGNRSRVPWCVDCLITIRPTSYRSKINANCGRSNGLAAHLVLMVHQKILRYARAAYVYRILPFKRKQMIRSVFRSVREEKCKISKASVTEIIKTRIRTV